MESTAPLKDIAVSESGFIFDPHSGATFTVNATGKAVLEAIRGGLSREDVVELLHEGFETAEADIQRDIDEFVHLLRRSGLVDPDFSL